MIDRPARPRGARRVGLDPRRHRPSIRSRPPRRAARPRRPPASRRPRGPAPAPDPRPGGVGCPACLLRALLKTSRGGLRSPGQVLAPRAGAPGRSPPRGTRTAPATGRASDGPSTERSSASPTRAAFFVDGGGGSVTMGGGQGFPPARRDDSAPPGRFGLTVTVSARSSIVVRTGGPPGAPVRPMKLIIAIIQPTKLEAVKEALSQVEVFRLTVMDVQGFGRQKGYTEVYRGHEFTVNLLRKIELQIAVNEDFVEPTVNAIIQAGPERRPTARSATARSSSCRWTTASASAPASAAPRRSDAMPIRAVIFDFNGVLVDDEYVHFDLFREVLAEEGVAIDEAALPRALPRLRRPGLLRGRPGRRRPDAPTAPRSTT